MPTEDQSSWQFIFQSVVPDLFQNTLKLFIFTILNTFLLGTTSAFFISFTDIPLKKYFQYLLLTGLSIPLYVFAFIYVGMFEFSGPFMSFFRETLGINLHQYINIKDSYWVSLVISFGLFPYVYIFTKNAFDNVGEQMIFASRSLGYSPMKTFLKLILPYSKPWIFSSLILVCMETLADFGAVSVFNYDTFTTAIYTSWMALFSLSSAARLSLFLVVMALLLFFIDSKFNKKGTHHQRSAKKLKSPLFKLTTTQKVLALFIVGGITFFSFFLPITQLAFWFLEGFKEEWGEHYYSLIFSTFKIGLIASLAIVILAFLMSYLKNYLPNKFNNRVNLLSLLGYALPGSIIAVAVFLYFRFFGDHLPIFQTGTLAVLILGLLIRFLSVGFRSLDNHIGAINPNLEKASKSLGHGFLGTLKRIFLPLSSKAALIGIVLVFIEVIKEMPMTLMLRPQMENTLAIKIFELTSEGEWERASISSVFLVCLGLISVYVVNKLSVEKN
ncbi:MAG: iron ABC transporter permease [Oligoflexia bacterium]|nr:iron ABC transporter permease [Oligoflexia bacterium]